MPHTTVWPLSLPSETLIRDQVRMYNHYEYYHKPDPVLVYLKKMGRAVK